MSNLSDSQLKLIDQEHSNIAEISRRIGQSEVASSILHNVGNVLNSINISATEISESIFHLQVNRLQQLKVLLENKFPDKDNSSDMSKIHVFFDQLCNSFVNDQQELLKEVSNLQKQILHIRDVISFQQTYSKSVGMKCRTNLSEYLQECTKLFSSSFEKTNILLQVDIPVLPQLLLDRQTVTSILVNLLKNAKEACLANPFQKEHKIHIQVKCINYEWLEISVADTGVGIKEEVLDKIFRQGFTTKSNGHGFGLHSAAISAQEMGGSLTVDSDGINHGARFTLKLPFEPLECLS